MCSDRRRLQSLGLGVACRGHRMMRPWPGGGPADAARLQVERCSGARDKLLPYNNVSGRLPGWTVTASEACQGDIEKV